MDEFKMVIAVLIVMIVLLGCCIRFGINKEVTMYNNINNTNYTSNDWFWSSEVLKKQNQSFKINN